MAKKKLSAHETELILARTRPLIKERRLAAEQSAQRTIRAMSQEVERCRESLAHHLLDLPLLHVLYYWTILRLKFRPWRVLVPVSLGAAVLYRLLAGNVPNLWTILSGGIVP